ncbi:hypothetical protein [Nonomuraea sp. KM90]|uniref:hypothetical protein n=1 Tax=Nonomuraea sp. KM90 TaxID=3457428 RepID=UPI003FCE256C
MLPEIEAYFAGLDEAQKTYDLDRHRARAENPVPEWRAGMSPEEDKAFIEAEDRRTRALSAVRKAYQDKRDQAFQNLATSDNPQVRFIAADPEISRGSYRQEAEAVLRALPLSREDLEAFGVNQGWCDTYERFFERADEAGVLPDPVPDLADIEPLVRELHEWGGSIVRVRAMVRKHLPDLIASALERQAHKALQPSA